MFKKVFTTRATPNELKPLVSNVQKGESLASRGLEKNKEHASLDGMFRQ
jgi:hypothetical protein